MFYNELKRYTYSSRYFIEIILVKEKEIRSAAVYYVSFEVHFISFGAHFCLSYEKINYCKIKLQIKFIKLFISDRRHFLVYTYF